MALNSEQTDLALKGVRTPNPFDIGPCFTAAFEAMKRHIFIILLGYLVYGVIVAVGTFIGIIFAPAVLVDVILTPALVVGFIRFHLKVLRNQDPSISDLFDGFNMFGQSLALAIVQIILITVGFILCIVPGIYLAVAWSFSWFYLSDKKYGFWECMEISRRVVTANWGWALLLIIVSNIISYVGLIAFIVGVLLTIPMYGLMIAAAYTRAVDSPDAEVSI